MKKLLPLWIMCCFAVSTAFAQGTIVAGITIDQATCSNNAILTASVASGGTAPFSFAWSTGETNPVINVLAPGTFTVLIRDAAGVERSLSTTVRSYIVPEIITQNQNIQCNNATVTLSVGGIGGSPFTWEDNTSLNPRAVTQAGTYTVQVSNGDMCSASVVVQNQRTDEVEFLNVSRCPDAPAFCFPNTTECYTDGTHTYIYTKPDGCTRTVTVTINITPYEIRRDTVSACDSYTVPGTVPPKTYTVSGRYTDELPLPSANGCRQFVRTTLTIGRSSDMSVVKFICQGDTYTVGDSQTGIMSSYTTSGNYIDTLKSKLSTHCDSIIRTQLTVDVPGTRLIRERRCTPFCIGTGPDQQCFTQTELRIFPGTTPGGCDNTVTYDVVISPTINESIMVGKCPGESYTSGSDTYTVTGVYTSTVPSFVYTDGSGGCDSITTVDFRIIEPTLRTLTAAICAGDTYDFNGTAYTAAGTYTNTETSYPYQGAAQGCDSVITTLNLTVKSINVLPAISYGICNGVVAGNVVLSASGGTTPYLYNWGAGAPTKPFRYCLPAGTYTVTITESSMASCATTQTIIIVADDPSNCLNGIEGFSPDGDPYNETWQIPCIEDKENTVRVYNRWGQILFEAKNYTGGWNGVVDGKPLPDATYYYVINTASRTYRGTLTIIRQ